MRLEAESKSREREPLILSPRHTVESAKNRINAMTAEAPKPKRNDELQAVRAIAIGLVIVSHLPNLFPWGGSHWSDIGKGFHIGVDLFLCLSGYVITKSLRGQLQTSTDDDFWRQVAAFWVRRLYRITPSAWVWIAIPLLTYSLYYQTINPAHLSDAVAAIVHVANIRNWQCAWTPGQQCGGFGHYWSLSLEEQFYLLLPFLFLIFRKRVHLALIAIVLVQVFLPRPAGSVLGAIKTDALMFGVLLALWSDLPSYRIFEPRLTTSRLRFIIAPLLVICLVGLARYQPVPFYLGMVAAVSAVIIWICSYDRGYFIADGAARRVMAWIGERSFAIYLIHPFTFWLTGVLMQATHPGVDFGGSFTLRFAATAVVLTMGMSELSYRLVEVPLRLRGAQRSRNIVEPAAAEVLPLRQANVG